MPKVLFHFITRSWLFLGYIFLSLTPASPCNYATLMVDGALRLNLENSINIAMTSERRLGGAIDALQMSEGGVELAKTAFDWLYYPKADAGYIGGGKAGEGGTVGAGVEFSKRFITGTRISLYPSIMKAAKHFQTNLKAVFAQPLLRGAGPDFTLAGLKGAYFARRTAARNLYQAKLRLILDTIEGLLEVVKQNALFAFDQETSEKLIKFAEATKLKRKIGLSDAFDVYRAEAERDYALETVITTRELLQNAKDALKDILALPIELPIEVDIVVEYQPIDVDIEECVQAALKYRIEIDQAKDALQESQRLERLAEKNLLPEINFVVDYSSCSRDEVFTRAWTCKRESRWGIGLTTSGESMNPADEFSYEQSMMNTDEAARNVLQTKDDVALAVRASVRNLTRYEAKIVNLEDQIEHAKKAFLYAQIRFNHGQANNFDLIQAENNLRLAQRSLIAAVIDYKQGIFQLLASMGLLLDKSLACASSY